MADKKELDDYQKASFYNKHKPKSGEGFSAFEDGDFHYFGYFLGGDLYMRSQAYTNKAGRDNGIKSVTKNMSDPQRYKTVSEGKKHYFDIVAGNGQSVARSVPYSSAKLAEEMATAMRTGKAIAKPAKAKAKKAPTKSKTAKAAKAAPAAAAVSKPKGVRENYHPLAFYQEHGKARKSGFDKFSHDGAEYFSYYKDGDILLISESYTKKAGRDNGVKSTRENMKRKGAYEFFEHKNGKHYFDINAKNKQEVATSVWFDNRAEAERAADALRTGKAWKAAAIATAATAAAVTAAASNRDEDNYHPLAFYERHAKGTPDGIEKFKGDDGLYYFTYNENDKIVLISEGYPTAAARDNGASSVVKNLPNEDRYVFKALKNGKHDFRLRAGNNQEIARSIWYGSAAAATTGAAYLMGKRKRAVAAPVAAVAAAGAAASLAAAKSTDKEDDYLKCAEYQGREVNDKVNNVALFKHQNGQFYFALYDADGDVRLRSEGFPTAKQRDEELSGVLRFKDDKSKYKRIEKNGYYMDVLHDETGREVGRSCLKKIGAPVAAAAPIAAAAAAAAPAGASAAAGASGGLGWLKWLLPLLLLLALLLFGLRYCGKTEPLPVTCWDGSKVVQPAECPAEPQPEPEPMQAQVTCWDGSMADTLEACPAEVKAMVTCWDGSQAEDLAACPARPTVACWDGSSAFSIAECPPRPRASLTPSSGSTPFGLTCGGFNDVNRLGTNPEFGDVHNMTPSGFQAMLASRAASNDFDRRYLNYVARNLGYSRFSAIPQSAFGETTLAYGTEGVLGFGEYHGFACSRLNVSDRDLQAFTITGANGVVVNYMKTCGNFFLQR